jgi:uncharacterized protein (DUF488 family)
MCSEEDPTECHRHVLIEPVLAELGIEMQHIRGDGQVQASPELEGSGESQLTLFAVSESAWRSVKAIRKPGQAEPR